MARSTGSFLRTRSPGKASRLLPAALLVAALVLPAGQADAYRPWPGASPAAAPAGTPLDADLHRSVARAAPAPLLNQRPAGAPMLLAEARTGQEQVKRVRPRQVRTARDTARKPGLVARALRPLYKRPKEVSPEKAAALIKGGDKVWVPVGQVTSNVILKALAQNIQSGKTRVDSTKPVEIVGLSNTASRSIFDREGKIVPRSLFMGANARDPIAAGRGDFVPVYFGRIPRMIREGKVPVDVAVVQVSKPDKLGFVTLGPTAGATIAALDQAKTIVAQVNDQVPRTRGATRIHISKLDYVVKANEPLAPIPAAEITQTDRQIAGHIVKLVLSKQDNKPRDLMARLKGLFRRDDVPTFQFGIGGIPDAVANQLAESKDLKACKVRSELIGPGTRKLVEAGKVKGKVNYTFAMGDQDFLKWMDNNRKLVARPVDILNDPARIAKNPNMVAVNSAMKVDLSGQVNAQYIRDSWYSGVGGQVDFMRGAMGSPGGKAIIALPATSMVSDGKGGQKLISKIVPRLGEGDVVTTNMHDLQYVVTEFGVAHLEGKGAVERARELIKVAHPQFRAELTKGLEDQIQRRKADEQQRFDAYKSAKN